MKTKGAFCIAIVIMALIHSRSLIAGDKMPERIVSLKPVITDILIAIGAGDRLVGATKYCDLSAIENKPRIVGDYTRPMIEKIVALNPDLVLNSEENSSRRSFERMKSLGIEVKLFQFRNTAEIISSVLDIGKAVGMESSAQLLASKTQNALLKLEHEWSDKPKKRGFIVWGRRPIIVAGETSYLGKILPSIGIENAAKKSAIAYPRIGVEGILAANPDFIVDLSMGSEALAPNAAWSKIKSCDAYKNGRIFILNADQFRPGPGLPEAMKNLAKLIHGEK